LPGVAHSGCDRRVAVAGVGAVLCRVAVGERTNTVSVTNAGSGSVTVLGGRACSGRVRSGC